MTLVPGMLTLIVDTPAGVLVRHIPNASPLPANNERGTAAEEAVRDAAAIWGLPDFTFRNRVIDVGPGRRELGDAILVVGSTGVVVQVKTRDPPSDLPDRERRWIEKQVTSALAQARGTIRRLKLKPARLTNARGRVIEIDGKVLRWVSVIVIDHPDPPPDVLVDLPESDTSATVMLRRDWEFLFDQLRSTRAVVGYLERIGNEPLALGDEPARYFELAGADQDADPDDIDPELLGPGARRVSAPLLPISVAPADRPAHLLVRSIFEDVALANLTREDERDRLAVLAELDGLPVNHRAQIGHFLLDGLRDSRAGARADETVWKLRRILGSRDTMHLAFGVCSRFSPEHRDLFAAWVQLRHHDHLLSRRDSSDFMTIGVLLSPRRDGVRAFDTTMYAVRGELGFSDIEIEAMREAWPTPS